MTTSSSYLTIYRVPSMSAFLESRRCMIQGVVFSYTSVEDRIA